MSADNKNPLPLKKPGQSPGFFFYKKKLYIYSDTQKNFVYLYWTAPGRALGELTDKAELCLVS